MRIREGTVDDVDLLARMFRQMWLDNGVSPSAIVADADRRVREFIVDAAQRRGLRSFFAMEDGVEVGGALCQLFAGLYPDILSPELRKYGYIWGVYVDPAARRRGVGELLTARCVAALHGAGCTHALLHAAPSGRGVYGRLGFEPTNELRLDLTAGLPERVSACLRAEGVGDPEVLEGGPAGTSTTSSVNADANAEAKGEASQCREPSPRSAGSSRDPGGDDR